ncbi:protein LKAAEAR1 isoform X2 [Dromiciops gliroides]|uniref:protein LKAAEAR1 isoform X2 n=1 Tax=Dromiciops gliroides TaxID=33562 RepID=UPI001CC68006|nr:protein LKAAEAR1 isoform X2 [Dromiciops gliroides]
MPGAQLDSDKGNKQKRTSSIKRETNTGKQEQEASAKKEAVEGNESRQKKKAAATTVNVTKGWKKVVTAKAAVKAMAARSREEFKSQSPWGEAKGLTTFLKKYPDALLRKDLASLSPAEAKRYLLFVEPKKAGSSALLPSDSIDSISSSQGCRRWELPAEADTEQQKCLIGVLKAFEARSRIRALRLRYTRMRRHRVEAILEEDNAHPMFR